MARMEPKVGTKGPVKTGGTGGGMSKDSVAEAMKPKKAESTKRVVVDTKRNADAMKNMK